MGVDWDFENNRPTADNLVPIRLDIEIDNHRFKDAFTWNPSGISLFLATSFFFLPHFGIFSDSNTLYSLVSFDFRKPPYP